MTRRRTQVDPWPPETDKHSCALKLPMHWTAEQAAAVFELLDDLNELVWRAYGGQIQQVLRRDRVTKMANIPANIDDGDVPF